MKQLVHVLTVHFFPPTNPRFIFCLSNYVEIHRSYPVGTRTKEIFMVNLGITLAFRKVTCVSKKQKKTLEIMGVRA